MKIAVNYDNNTGEVFQHFGNTEYFKIYDTENGGTSVVSTEGTDGHTALIPFLKENGVDLLLAGGLGERARVLLKQAGIKFYPGCSGKADDVVEDYINGRLKWDDSVTCHGGCHHHEGE